MDEASEEVFAQLFFEKYDEALNELHEARRKRYAAEVECKNLEERIQLLQWRISHQAAFEKRELEKLHKVSDIDKK